MYRKLRVFLGIVLPPFLGTIGMTLMFAVKNDGILNSVGFLGILVFAYFFQGVQSLIYSLVMEFFVSRFIRRSSRVSIVAYFTVSMLLGVISGGSMVLSWIKSELLFFLITGGVVALLIPFPLLYLHREELKYDTLEKAL